jgi:hypothetical protein
MLPYYQVHKDGIERIESEMKEQEKRTTKVKTIEGHELE